MRRTASVARKGEDGCGSVDPADGRLYLIRHRPGDAIGVGLHADVAFLNVPEVASLLRTSAKAVYAMIERRQLPGVTRIGRRILIRQSDLLDWLRQKSAPSPEE